MFDFSGALEISKSWMNRALILQSFEQKLNITGNSSAEDVVLLKNALEKFKNNESEFYAGLGGTTFRFLAFRVSRKPGEYFIRADKKLLARPQREIVNLLARLGVWSELTADGLKIKSTGWKKPNQKVIVQVDESSQFLSALALSTIDLDFDFEIEQPKKITSEGYFEMTLKLLASIGVQFGSAHQKIKNYNLTGEVDISSAFSLVSAAVLDGKVEINNWATECTQPDIMFLQFFEKMGIHSKIFNNQFSIIKQIHFKGLYADISNCPDLFPVLSVLCAFAEGQSNLFNAPQLKHKESDRIEKTFELLNLCGFRIDKKQDGLIIQGQPSHSHKTKDLILFDPEGDHRMAMAAGLLMIKGFPIKLPQLDVVNKSYPQFFQHIGVIQ